MPENEAQLGIPESNLWPAEPRVRVISPSNAITHRQPASINSQIDPNILSDWSRGASSIVADRVRKELETLPEELKMPIGVFFTSPGAAIAELSAQAKRKEMTAESHLQVTHAAADIAEMAATETRREVFEAFIRTLNSTYGSKIEQYCQEQGIILPDKRSFDYQLLLIRINSYQHAIMETRAQTDENMSQFIKTRINLEGRVNFAKLQNLYLPEVNAQEAEMQNLQIDGTFKTASNGGIRLGSAIFGAIGGFVGAGATGIILGALAGIIKTGRAMFKKVK
jgi:hypothetical protein